MPEKKKTKTKIRLPPWLRIFNLIFGILYILLAVAILFNLTLGEITLIYILALNLLLLGIVKIVTALNQRLYNKKLMAVNFFLGIIVIGVTIFIFLSPETSVEILIYLIMGGLVLQAIYRFFFGIFNKDISKWATFLNLIVSIIILIVAGIVFFYPDLAVLTLIILLSFSFILNGVGRIMTGITGYLKIEEK